MPPTPRKRRRRYTVAVLAVILAIPLVYRAVFIYRWRPALCTTSTATILQGKPSPGVAAPADTIRIATWNVEGHAALLSSGHVGEIAEAIVRTKADVVALQEVHRGTWQARFGDQLAELARRANMSAAWSPSYSLMGEFGNAILTRGTIVSARRILLPSTGEPRSALVAVVEIRGRRIPVVSTHLSSWGSFARDSRTRELDCLASLLTDPALIVAGDLNAAPDAPEMERLYRAGFRDVDPLGQPTHRLMEEKIDYLLVTPSWRARTATVEDEDASDHRPLIADLEESP